MAGKQYKAAAEMYESQIVDLNKALQYYELAIDSFENEDSESTVDKLKLKVAEISAQQEKFDKAFDIYETVASRMTEK